MRKFQQSNRALILLKTNGCPPQPKNIAQNHLTP